MLLSLCIVGNDDSSNSKAVVAGAEDGTVIIWDISSSSSSNRSVQIVPHPGCVWGVSNIGTTNNNNSPSTTDFVTVCHDGHVRIFTRVLSKMASDTTLSSFQTAVSSAQASRSTGPSVDEIAKLPQWEMNTLTQGRSDGQVQVFQRDGKAIAAQWSTVSRTWIEVGEVTGSNVNAGSINGIHYDHVFPIEIDMPGGGVQTLQIGYNNGDNPFVTAQSFIDTHTLNQGYLGQIADYIRQRAGETGPTLGMDGGSSNNSNSGGGGIAPTMMETTPIYNHIPMRGYKVFDAGVDKAGLGKVLSKICEFNDSALLSSKYRLTGSDIDNTLSSLIVTLSTTNRYHVSTISDIELGVVHTMITKWDVKYAFPALDLARVMALHPDATCAKRRGYWIELLSCTLDMCLGLVDGSTGFIVDEVAIPMLTMRLIANCYKGGSGSADAAGSMMDR
jgi:phospholipase A-2-activating protein